MGKPALNCLFLKNFPILEQLQLEEALLRASSENFCIINQGTPPAIVMGISGNENVLIDSSKWALEPVPVIRRFSGGGTVVVDENTFFVTFLFNDEDIQVPCQIDAIHRYLEAFWKEVFKPLPFRLVENDYVIGEKKMGGNAQYLTKKRWLHHTSFLWDFDPQRMQLLSYPPKTPCYRQGRSHLDFLTPLSSCFTSQEEFLAKIKDELAKRFALHERSFNDYWDLLSGSHRKQTTEVSISQDDVKICM